MVSSGIEFDTETIARALVNIYKELVDIDHDVEANLFRETSRIIGDAIDNGYADAVSSGSKLPDDAFRDAFKHSADVFSAFRVHKMQKDIAAQMIDSDGQLKPFRRFVKDVAPYIEHKNRAWLQTEYDTAVIRAQNAVEWQQFQAEKDVYPNLEWIPSTSPNPGADHRVFWGTVLPVDDPFWDEHKPGDRWNCKCELRQTDKGCTAAPSSDGKSDAAPGLDSNPAKSKEVFSDNHPYFPGSCSSCPFVGNKLVALAHNLAGGKHCMSCKFVDHCIKDKSTHTVQPPAFRSYKKVADDVYMSPYHGKGEKQENIRVAKILQRIYHERVFLLPNINHQTKHEIELREKFIPNGVKENKNPDFLISGKFYECKGMMGFEGNPKDRKAVKSAIEDHIKKAKTQADNIVLLIPETIPSHLIHEFIKNYLNLSKTEREIVVLHGKKTYRYDNSR